MGWFDQSLSVKPQLTPSTLHLLFLSYQIRSSWSSSSAACVSIRAGVTRRTSPSCPCVVERGTSCAAMTGLWSSPTCCRTPKDRRASWETRSSCRTAAERRSWPSRSDRRHFTCILTADECITPAQSEQAASAWSGRLWPSSSARSLFTLQSRANQDSRHTYCGEGRSTCWLMSWQEASLQQRRAGGRSGIIRHNDSRKIQLLILVITVWLILIETWTSVSSFSYMMSEEWRFHI